MIRTVIMAALVLTFADSASAQSLGASRRGGEYVARHYSAPDNSYNGHHSLQDAKDPQKNQNLPMGQLGASQPAPDEQPLSRYEGSDTMPRGTAAVILDNAGRL